MRASFDEAWLHIVSDLFYFGAAVDVRGNSTLEILGDQISFPMETCILCDDDRCINKDFMFREAWWILSGQNNLSLIQAYAPSYKQYSDDGIRLSGAYGPKVVDQIRYVVDILRGDPSSRQAVINIWRENPRESKDVPCTLSVQFLIRDNIINTVVNMRSSDVWLGLPYDVFTFTMLTCQIALELDMGLQLGTMFHNAGSRHLYYRNKAKAEIAVKYINTKVPNSPEISLPVLRSVIGTSNEFHQLLLDRSMGKIPRQITKLIPWLK